MKVIFLIAIVFALALTVIAVKAQQPATPLPVVGQLAPPFTLTSQDGSSISLESFRGKWVVVYFYPKDMTPGCTIEAHNFQRDLASYEAANAVILGISADTAESHQQFCTKEGLSFRLLADPVHHIIEEYGSLGGMVGLAIANRNTFLINPEGRIVQIWTKVSVQHHSEEVLAAIHALQKK